MIYPLTTLEEVFRAEDMEGLIALGAPDDEYDSEAFEVQTELEALEDREMSQACVSTIVANVWRGSFGPFDEDGWRQREPVLRHLVQRILEQRPVTTKRGESRTLAFDESANARRPEW